MKLSVIVVSHNLDMWLRQCIGSLVSACKYIDYELIVVDNASNDSSAAMVQQEFPNARLIKNDKNVGTAKAYNQGIGLSRGEYVLLVSPDTLTKKKTLEKLISFMDDHYAVAGSTVRMVNPHGEFLPFSKNGLGKSWSRLIRWTGLGKYFPKSHLYPQKNNHISNEYETAEIDVLNCAFMMLRRSVLNKVGMFDERFKSFGYNIDLSFRLKTEGFKNYYFPKTYIINFNVQPQHGFKYFRHFYGAMFIFVAKYLFEAPKLTLGRVPQAYSPRYEVEQ
ncbi:glycosyltransferase family 2 protein [Mucilaginibacter limnophilus]|uniref:Glycosyltransferase family 2 protein n=1 Tax=Mucilaginibacter limnophilus TaxID=1932778 RepID=A0A3S2VAN1_9SPHI|nr:glycosyltransferase family 2 protein [Mucilaginibacter limnophilus]RVU02932.1 glycosyltransferase family 2 protein [Mucilaginibacter limnophilus]